MTNTSIRSIPSAGSNIIRLGSQRGLTPLFSQSDQAQVRRVEPILMPHSARSGKLIATAMKAAWAAACAAAARSNESAGALRSAWPAPGVRTPIVGWAPRAKPTRRPACSSTGPRLRRYGQVSAQQGRAPLDRPLRAPINLKPMHHAFHGDGGQTTAHWVRLRHIFA